MILGRRCRRLCGAAHAIALRLLILQQALSPRTITHYWRLLVVLLHFISDLTSYTPDKTLRNLAL